MASVVVPDARARDLLKNELQRRGIGYRDLAERLALMGLPTSEREVTEAIDTGDVPATFLAQCFEAMGAPVIHLDY
jgi:hypothetical protein